MLGTKNSDANLNNTIFIIKETKLYIPVVTLSAKDDKKLLRKRMKDLNIGMNVKQKVRIEIRQKCTNISQTKL